MDITLKDKALEMLEKKLGPGEFLKISITEGGCAGLTYGAEVTVEMDKNDFVVHEIGTIRIVADETSKQYLNGLVIDYSDDLIGGGLRFTNPSAKSTCGCGASFNLSGFPVLESGKCGN